MSHSHAPSLPLPNPAFTREVQAARQRGDRGRQQILWGWVATMAGVACYCRALFGLDTEAGALDALTRTGVLGWTASGLMLFGVALWILGNLRYLHDVMEATESGKD
ncbi:MAG: hypothetical protein HYZ13_08480 [Acidobacteria bacterium]|nr:hypothetical protein [Acidobacteriota bacterium]